MAKTEGREGRFATLGLLAGTALLCLALGWPLWWFSQTLPEAFTWTALSGLALGIGWALFFRRPRRKAKKQPLIHPPAQAPAQPALPEEP